LPVPFAYPACPVDAPAVTASDALAEAIQELARRPDEGSSSDQADCVVFRNPGWFNPGAWRGVVRRVGGADSPPM
jgi:hypothetical protein